MSETPAPGGATPTVDPKLSEPKLSDPAPGSAGDIAAIADLQKQIDALTTKNAELITEKRTVSGQLADAKKAASDAETAKVKAAGNVEELEQRLRAESDTAVAEVQGKLEAAEKKLYTLQVDRGLQDAMASAGIAEPHRKAVAALLKADHKVETGEDGAMIDGKPLAQFVTEWAATDTGKLYVSAPVNGGGAAPGSPSGGAVPKKKSEMSAKEKGAFIREKGEAAFTALPA